MNTPQVNQPPVNDEKQVIAAKARTAKPFRRQLDTLIHRELALMWGRFSTLILLIAQAPLIAYFIGVAWRNEEPKRMTFFVMVLAAVWMGCMNACTAIVRERAIFNRERMFQLNLNAYIGSKFLILVVMIGIQSILLLVVQAKLMRLTGGLSTHIGYFLTLTLAGSASAALGLFISACSKTNYGAVLAVPILLMPQIIFSEPTLGANIDKKIPGLIADFTITRWAFPVMETFTQREWEWSAVFEAVFFLGVGGVGLLVLAGLKLRLDEWDG